MMGLGYAGLSGILLTLGFAPFEQAWLGWIALIPLAFYIVWKGISCKEAARLGYFFGIIHFLSSLFWLTNVSWLGWVILSAYLAIYPAIWAALWSKFSKHQTQELTSGFNLHTAIYGASAWVALEWVRGWLWTGFPWNMLGVTQANMVAIIQIADIGGVYLISWLAAFANFVFALHLRRLLSEIRGQQALRPRFDLIAVILILVASFVYGVHRLSYPAPSKSQLQYLAIQPSIEQDPWKQAPVAETLSKLESLTRQGLENLSGESLPHLIIWPETPIPVSVFEHGEFFKIANDLVRETSSGLLLGSNDYIAPKVYNSAVLFQSDISQVYHKRHLVLMGEYVPFTRVFPFLRKFVPPGVDFSSGQKSGILKLNRPELKMGVFICFEDTLAKLARDAMTQSPDFFINLTNDGWFKKSAASRQHLNNALFRTIEFRRPMLRVTNNGTTALITETGIPSKIFQDEKTKDTHASGFMRGMMIIPEGKITVYQKLGDWIPKVCFLIGFFGFFRVRKKDL